MDKIDLKLLESLNENAKYSISQVARRIRVSQQVADYRIKKLGEQGVILGFHTVINPLALGFRLFRISIWFSKINEEFKESFLSYLKNQENVAWVGFTNSVWDLIIDYYAKSPLEVENFINNFSKKFQNIDKYDVSELTLVIEKQYPYLSKKQILYKIQHYNKKVDVKDHKILISINKNARKPLVEISKETNLSIPTIRERIKKMEKEGIISGYRMFCNPKRLERESYKLIFSLQHYKPEEIESLINFGILNENVIYIAKYFGNYNLDFEVECKNKEELQVLIIKIRNRSQIREIQIVSVLSDIELNHYPFKNLQRGDKID